MELVLHPYTLSLLWFFPGRAGGEDGSGLGGAWRLHSLTI